MSYSAKLARPYAKAAFEEALKQHTVEHWVENLNLLAAAVESPALSKAIKDPRYESKQLGDILISINEQKFDDTDSRFINLLAENDRLNLLPEIARQFEAMRAEKENKVEAHVISAVPLSDDYEQNLIETLSKRLHCHVTLNTTVNPSILGGLIVRVGDKVFDASVQGQLQSMRTILI